jgi:hypothetical protein
MKKLIDYCKSAALLVIGSCYALFAGCRNGIKYQFYYRSPLQWSRSSNEKGLLHHLRFKFKEACHLYFAPLTGICNELQRQVALFKQRIKAIHNW